MAENKVLQILLTAKDEASKVLKNFDGAVADTGKTLQNAGAFLGKVALGVGAFAGVAVVGAKKMVDAFAESQAQMAISDTMIKTFSQDTLNTMGGSFEEAQKKIGDFGQKLQDSVGISGEEASIGLTKLVASTKDFQKAQELANLAADLAKFKQVDYGTAVNAVAKMMNGSTKELNAMGIETDKNATAQQNLTTLMGLTAGQAQAFGQTIEGQTAIMTEKFGDLQENIGQMLLPVVTKVFEAINALIPVINGVVSAVGSFITKMLESEAVKFVLKTITDAFAQLWSAVMMLWNAFQPYIPFLTMLAQIVGVVLYGAFLAIIKVIQWLIQYLAFVLNAWKAVYDFIVTYLIKAIGKDINDAVNLAGKAFNWLLGIGKSVFEGISNFIRPVIDTITSLINKISAVKDLVGNVLGGVANTIGGAVNTVFGGGKAVGGNVQSNRAYMVGERGSEMFIPNTNGTIIPNNALGGGQTINITVTGNQLLDDRAGDKIGDMIINKLKYQLNLN